MIEEGATHLGVATDHVIESFRNDLWPHYKTGEGIEPVLLSQFHPIEEALTAMGIMVWPMVELEADDALASAAYLAATDPRVLKICIWTPDKDLAQSVQEDRVVQVDSKSGTVKDANAIVKKFGVHPVLIPDFLALVGDSADGYPGISGIGKSSAARLLNQHGPIENFPKNILGGQRERALLFKRLATLRTDALLFTDVSQMRWAGPTPAFEQITTKIGAPALLIRANAVASKIL
jgi:5'-3' exonuclease